MHRVENDNDIEKVKKQTEPICLFCFPEYGSLGTSLKKSYVHPVTNNEFEKVIKRKTIRDVKQQKPSDESKRKIKEDTWMKKRHEARMLRRRMKEPIRNLKTILLTPVPVKNDEKSEKTLLPSLYEVLETVKDAWPPPIQKNFTLFKQEEQKPINQNNMFLSKTKMKEEVYLQFPSPLINRRYSMPEELMRKYSILKEKTSDESDTNKTATEATSSTSSATEETIRIKPSKVSNSLGKSDSLGNIKITRLQEEREGEVKIDQKTTSESITIIETPKRVTQTDYYSQGKSIIKVKNTKNNSTVKVCMCLKEKMSSTTPSVKDESDESGTSDSIASSSPVQLPKREISSDNLSSESDYIVCTCREITSSKETSTDIFYSGKSTLSQTISEKSYSTQDSTISVKSVSTRGSTPPSDYSMSTTSDAGKKSAKESTTSDYSPKTPRHNSNRKSRKRERYHREEHKKFCPKYYENKNLQNNNNTKYSSLQRSTENKEKEKKFCDTDISKKEKEFSPKIVDAKKEFEALHGPIKQDNGLEVTKKENENETAEKKGNVKEKEEGEEDEDKKEDDEKQEDKTDENEEEMEEPNQYIWTRLNQDELYMMQQLRNHNFFEKGFSIPIECNEDFCEITDVITSICNETDNLNESIMIPRYSALPRTLSMLVNTSSADNSIQNSDSDSQSLADSLEDQPTTHIHKFYFDTKNESKPVRGDVNIVQEIREKKRVPKGKAFFVSIRSPFGEVEMLEGIKQIPQPPEKIKNQIFERHLSLCTKHKQSRENKKENKINRRKKYTRNKKKETEKITKNKKIRDKENKEEKHSEDQTDINKPKKTKVNNEENFKEDVYIEKQKKQEESNENENFRLNTKRKNETKQQKLCKWSKIPILVNNRPISSSEKESDSETNSNLNKKEKGLEIETTEILEITRKNDDVILQEPQNINFSSQNQNQIIKTDEKIQTNMPPIVSNSKFLPHFRQTQNRSMYLNQTRKSPVTKFRQRFEVIPEEKSSSLSSTEEKTSVEPLPKFTNASTSPLPVKEDNLENVQYQNYNITQVPDLIVAQIKDKQLQTLPYVHGVNDQNIILFSSKPQNSNSTKGRDALIAMNREDFRRLAKGWINFYKLREMSENSDVENKGGKKKKRILKNDFIEKDKKKDFNETASKTDSGINSQSENDNKKMKNSINKKNQCLDRKTPAPTIDENIRFHSSNTILQTTISEIKKQSSLPELTISNSPHPDEITKSKSTVETLPKVTENSEETSDTDSTDYMEPPSPRVPPLPLEDLPSDASITSTESEVDESNPENHRTNAIKPLDIDKKEIIRNQKVKNDYLKTSRIGKKKNSGWSVTVAGTVELTKSAPDLEMKLSFPLKEGKRTALCQTDSSIVDSDYYIIHDQTEDSSPRKALSGNVTQRWKVTVENSNQDDLQNNIKSKSIKNSSHLLPELDERQTKSSRKALKKDGIDKVQKDLILQKLFFIWPEVQKIIKKKFLGEGERLIEAMMEDENCFLYVKGTAIQLEKKKRALTMTERDVTRRYTDRKSM